MTGPVVELRSDTFTRPTPRMRCAMAEAEVGDDVWDEDPTVHRLEALAAELTGKEAALFVSSGTQGNLTGILSHTRQGDEVIAGDKSHVFVNEVAGAAVVGGIQLRTVPNGEHGRINPLDVRAAIRSLDIHYPRTGCVSIENTHNRCGGAAISAPEIEAVADVAHQASIPVHVDGARIFNAAIALNVPVRTLVASADSVTFCLSKGLGAPVGSMLCGPASYIQRAKRWRKLLGGGMRQVGVLAAAGLIALNEQVDRLAEDHANARRLADGLASLPGISIDPRSVETNMVFFEMAPEVLSVDEFISRLADRGVLVASVGATTIRAVTSLEVTAADIDRALEAVRDVVAQPSPVTA